MILKKGDCLLISKKNKKTIIYKFETFNYILQSETKKVREERQIGKNQMIALEQNYEFSQISSYFGYHLQLLAEIFGSTAVCLYDQIFWNKTKAIKFQIQYKQFKGFLIIINLNYFFKYLRRQGDVNKQTEKNNQNFQKAFYIFHFFPFYRLDIKYFNFLFLFNQGNSGFRIKKQSRFKDKKLHFIDKSNNQKLV
ncbi:unnamed protein product [Paramecium sonneborni]|uniref:Uncharacterized protein n=1 Tax=Paramecium sonneborni TaxID=65129 RepID=A0A8S1PVA4_9CILI|nr:unnamed protein product [Paramecium sonneborni]